MPTIVFANPKGGAGKSTAALLLATELALETDVCVVDADVRRRIAKWAAGGNAPARMTVVDDVDEETVIDRIDEAAGAAPVVIVDLEGTASKLVLLAISQADLVVIPLQDSAPDAEEAAAVIRVIRQQERMSGRKVPYVVVRTRTPAAYRSRLMTYVLAQLQPTGARILETEIVERQAFKALWVYQCPLENLPSAEVSGTSNAIKNARAYAQEVVQALRGVATA
ncbi:ParA family protein [Roseateles sp. BYS78W]|uniref:ParA family protein n=1 Tax=Pelomonas candidula TaxID=3299025 RepID=A0ABW7HEF7_9BURK